MEIRNILVGLDIDALSSDLVTFACHLAQSNQASVTGFAAAEPMPIAIGMDGGSAATVVYNEQRAEIEQALAAAEAQFRKLIPSDLSHSWWSGEQDPSMGLVDIACRADLIVLGSPSQGHVNRSRQIDPDDVLLRAGRPVVIAAQGATQLDANKILIAWKNTKEARRTVIDALAFLKAAEHVKVVSVREGDYPRERDSMMEVVEWLQTHGVKAEGEVFPGRARLAESIVEAAVDFGAGMIVSGAYGHSRFREWLLGGVTRELLGASFISRFMCG